MDYRQYISRNDLTDFYEVMKTTAVREVEDLVEAHVCKLCVILRSRVRFVLLGLMQAIQFIYEEDKI